MNLRAALDASRCMKIRTWRARDYRYRRSVTKCAFPRTWRFSASGDVVGQRNVYVSSSRHTHNVANPRENDLSTVYRSTRNRIVARRVYFSRLCYPYFWTFSHERRDFIRNDLETRVSIKCIRDKTVLWIVERFQRDFLSQKLSCPRERQTERERERQRNFERNEFILKTNCFEVRSANFIKFLSYTERIKNGSNWFLLLSLILKI